MIFLMSSKSWLKVCPSYKVKPHKNTQKDDPVKKYINPGKITTAWIWCLLLSVQVLAEQRMSLQPMDNQSSDTNPQQPNSCHPSSSMSPPCQCSVRYHPTIVSQNAEIKHVNINAKSAVVRDLRSNRHVFSKQHTTSLLKYTISLQNSNNMVNISILPQTSLE